MATILHLETATKQCSVALARKGKLLASRRLLNDSFSHSEKLHTFINEVLEETATAPNQLDAIAVSKGPGSYTGLRIGVAAAKGLCFALDLPLIALNSLEILIQSVAEPTDFILPMLDARRMEVYTAVFDGDKKWVQETAALVIDSRSFLEIAQEKKVIVVGDGAKKFQALKPQIQADFPELPSHPEAKEMIEMAWAKFNAQDFESLAYFEPFYLKEFQTTPPKKPI